MTSLTSLHKARNGHYQPRDVPGTGLQQRSFQRIRENVRLMLLHLGRGNDDDLTVIPGFAVDNQRWVQMGESNARKRPKIPALEIMQAVSLEADISVEQLKGQQRNRRITAPRQLVMWILTQHLGLSFPMVGRLLNRDHTTIMHGARNAATKLVEDPDFLLLWQRVRERLGVKL